MNPSQLNNNLYKYNLTFVRQDGQKEKGESDTENERVNVSIRLYSMLVLYWMRVWRKFKRDLKGRK